MYDQRLSEGIHQFIEGGNMKLPSWKRIIDAWFQLSKDKIIKSLKCCDLNLAKDSTEDDFIHCLKKGQPCEAGMQKLNSQL